MIEESQRRLLPPLESVRNEDRARTKANASRQRTNGRFQVLNRFADEGARHVSTTDQACWWIVFRATRDGAARLSHTQIAECIGMTPKTVGRAMRRLEDAGLLTVLDRVGWRLGPSTYRANPVPRHARARSRR